MSSHPYSARRGLFVISAVLATLTALCFPASAQSNPPPTCRAATMVVAGGAGSGTDLIARALAEAANRAGAKPPISVRNVDSGEGVDGAAMVKDAPGNGCMMLLAHQGMLANFLTWRASFAWHEFRHVALITRTPMVLAAPVSAPFDDAHSLLEAARAGPVIVGVGPGTVAEFTLRAMAEAAQVGLQYDAIDGARERILSLLAGEIQLTAVTSALGRRLRETQKVKLIAVTDRARSSLLPELETLREQDLPFDYAIDLGVLLPLSASPEFAAQLADILEKATEDREFRDAMRDYDVRIDFRPLTQYTIYWENVMAMWRELAVEAGYERASR